MAYILTIAARLRHEIDKIKGSRFIATASPAVGVDDAMALAAALREEIPGATHHCWAWRGNDRDAFRYADDGEPSGSAGRPILSAIDGRRLTCVAVVVTRFFGGTKLGTGGLVRAYGSAAAAVLDRAEQVRVPITASLALEFDYDLSGAVQAHLSAHSIEPERADYGERIRMTVHVPVESMDAFVEELNEKTALKVKVEPS